MMKQCLAGIALAAVAALAPAQAQTYVTGSLGMTHASDDCDGVSSCDKTGVGFKLLGGYKLSPNLAVEGGFYNLGKITAKDAGIDLSIKTTGLGVGVAVFGDIAPQVNVVGRLALASLKTKVSASYLGASASDSESNVGVLLGAGIGYALTKNLSIDATLDLGKHKYADGSANVTMFGLGLTASF